jgi:Spy/CpxP family protein refolding chaperone
MKKHLHILGKAGVAVLAAGILGTLFITAAEPQQKRPQNQGRGGIPLDDQQRRLYWEALQQYRGELGKLGGRYHETTKQIIEITLSENFSEKAVREKIDELVKIHADMLVIRARSLSTLAPTLKPEQHDQLVERFGMEILYGRMDRDPRARLRQGGR